jgi:hypothetical protein
MRFEIDISYFVLNAAFFKSAIENKTLLLFDSIQFYYYY